MKIKTKRFLLKLPIIISLILSLVGFVFGAESKGGISFILHLLFGLLTGLGIRHSINFYARRVRYKLLRPVHFILPVILSLALYFSKGLGEGLLIFILFMSGTGIAGLLSDAEQLDQSSINAKGDPILLQFQAFDRYLPQIAKRCQRLSFNQDWQKALKYYQETAPDLQAFKKRAKQLVDQRKISDSSYERILLATEEAEEELQLLFNKVKAQPTWEEHMALGYTRANLQKDVKRRAPEIAAVYDRILADHDDIIKLIETTNPVSKEELLVLQENRMRQCDDVVKGYLQIKAKPKRHVKASAKLKKAQEALEQLDKELDDILCQLNETTLMDFEVSLRLLSGKQRK